MGNAFNMGLRRWHVITSVLLLASLTVLGASCGGPTYKITEYPIPTPQSQPGGIAVGRDGGIWFTEQAANKVVRASSDGRVTEYDVPTTSSTPGGITSGPDGALWFTEYAANKIGRITTEGQFQEYPIPTSGSSPNGITSGPDGALWFTETYGNKIGRISTKGVMTEFPAPSPGTYPSAITRGPDDALWFVEPDPNNRIGRVTTKGKFSEYPVPSKNIPGQIIPGQITAGPDGAVWLTAVGKQVGGPTVVDRISTKGEFKEFKVPGGRRDLWGITTGPDRALWFCENMSNKVVRMTTGGGFTEYSTPTKKIAIQNGTSFVISPTWIVSGPRRTIWFTENGANNIAVLRQTNTK